jgi:hypothetical protein
MSEQTLKANLDQLRKLLADPGSLDEAAREQLADVADTIENVLDESEPDYQAAHSSIEQAAIEFEARHPAFARILSELTDALAKLGI